jgi:hypothetical protein
MSGARESRFEDRLGWLLIIGRRLREQYDAIAVPPPAPLALLLQQLEARAEREAIHQPGHEAGAYLGSTAKPPARSNDGPAPISNRTNQ